MNHYKELIREHLKDRCEDLLCEPSGILPYPYLVSGSKQYSTTLWEWDSWLTDVGVRQIQKLYPDLLPHLYDYERGCIQNFLHHTKEDGYMPICIEVGDATPFWTYEPNVPQNIHKPCLAQHCAFVAQEDKNAATWVQPLLPALRRFLGYYRTNAFHQPTGLYFFQNDMAIGVDNDPCIFFRPARSTASIYLNCLLYRELLAMGALCRLCNQETEAADWEKQAKELADAVNTHCYDPLNGFYYNVDINLLPNDNVVGLHQGAPRSWDGLIMRIDVWSGAMALWAGIAGAEQAEAVRRRLNDPAIFQAEYGIRTLSKQEKMYSTAATNNPSNWLGPCWGISNYMTFAGLRRYGFLEDARLLAEKTIRLFGRDLEETGTLHEYYDPDTGRPVMTPGFIDWNILAINMICWLDGEEYVQEF